MWRHLVSVISQQIAHRHKTKRKKIKIKIKSFLSFVWFHFSIHASCSLLYTCKNSIFRKYYKIYIIQDYNFSTCKIFDSPLYRISFSNKSKEILAHIFFFLSMTQENWWYLILMAFQAIIICIYRVNKWLLWD